MEYRPTTFRSSSRLYRSYSIGQLCREFDLTPRAVRFYEAQGLISPARSGEARIFSYRDRARLALVVRGRRVGLSIADIRVILQTYDKDGEAAQAAVALDIFRRRVAALEAERVRVDEAIAELQVACGRMDPPAEPARPAPVAAVRRPEPALSL